MRRTIVGWHRGDDGDWVADLSCLHGQHVRHAPPFRLAPWVEDADRRVERIGTAWDCPLCDRVEPPDGLVVIRTTATWDEGTTPEALRGTHQVAAGRWGRLRVLAGALRFVVETEPPLTATVTAGRDQAIPPEVDHHVVVEGPVRFCIDLLGRPEGSEEGGDPACWSHRLGDSLP